ncbi:MAG: baseplate J/gp47 family protein [Parashewanella sp.]
MRPNIDFKKLLKAQNVPTTEQELKTLLDKDVKEAGSLISNNSSMSPFWRLFSGLVAKPVTWLINDLLVKHVLPNMFMATAKGAYLNLKAWELDTERKGKTKAIGKLRFYKDNINDVVSIDSETRIHTDVLLGKVYTVLTTKDVVIPAGVESALVVVVAQHEGAAYNLGAGSFIFLPSSIDGISHVGHESDWLVSAGSDIENDEALALRLRDLNASKSNFHIDAAYRAIIAGFDGVRTDHVFFTHDAPRGAGSANAYLMMASGLTPQPLIDEINAHISGGNHGHGDDLKLFAMPRIDLSLSVKYWHKPNLSDEDKTTLENQIKAMINAAMRESNFYPQVTRTRPYSTFSFSKLTGELHQELPELEHIEFSRSELVSELNLPVLKKLTLDNKGER